MALTLGDLRTFCQDVASPDSSGLKAERQFMVAINAALARIYTEFQWDTIDLVQKITMLPAVTGSALTVTQGSLALALTGAETFDSDYVTDEWALVIDGESRFNFELASIDDSPTNQTATLKAGDEWLASSATGVSYTFAQWKYTLPNNATQVKNIQILNNGFKIQVLTPAEFDAERAVDPGQQDSQPRIACYRGGKVELWPLPDTDYIKLEVTYRRGPPNYGTADADSTELDWPEAYEDLVHKALQLEFSLIDGPAAILPLSAAVASFEDTLGRYKALDGNKAPLTGPMCPQIPGGRPRLPVSYSGGTFTEV